MKALAVFAAEYDVDGCSLGSESKMRCLAALKDIDYNRGVVILLAAGLGNKQRPHLAELMKEYLVEGTGVPRDHIVICGEAENTSGEIEAFEKHISGHPEISTVTAISSWYHLPRIATVWLLRHKRSVHLEFVPVISHGMLGRACLEPFKTILMLMPINNERKLAIKRWFNRFDVV